jgi:hypothetical protein
LETDSDEAISSDTESESDEDTVAEYNNNNVTGSQDNIWSKPQHLWNSGDVYTFTGALSGFKIQEATHMKKGLFIDYSIFFSSSQM